MSVMGSERYGKRHCSHRHTKSTRESQVKKEALKKSPASLLDVAAKFVAKTIPF